MFFFPASLRLGGEKVTYDRHCLVVGDAAGMIDPLTGDFINPSQNAFLVEFYWIKIQEHIDVNKNFVEKTGNIS